MTKILEGDDITNMFTYCMAVLVKMLIIQVGNFRYKFRINNTFLFLSEIIPTF